MEGGGDDDNSNNDDNEDDDDSGCHGDKGNCDEKKDFLTIIAENKNSNNWNSIIHKAGNEKTRQKPVYNQYQKYKGYVRCN